MNTLLQGMEKTRYVELLLSLTKISSEGAIDAIHDHLVKGYAVDISAALNSVTSGTVSRAISKLEVVNRVHIALNECEL